MSFLLFPVQTFRVGGDHEMSIISHSQHGACTWLADW